MRAIQINEYVKGPQGLHPTTLPDPSPQSSQYLVDIHAAATNFFDILQVQGKYQRQPPFPWVAGFEFSGVIVQQPSRPRDDGSEPRFRVGDRVFGGAQGAYATKIAVDESSLRPVPDGWSFVDAAGLFVTAPTSFAALVTRANVQPGEYVLIHAAAGGVGLAAVQIAKALGATVIAACSTAHKRSVARSFGADHVIDYSNAQSWPDQVQALTPDNRGVDVVFDPVGLIATSLRCMAWNGRAVVVGFAGGAIEKVAMNKILLKNVSLMGVHWGGYAVQENGSETVEGVWTGVEDLIRTGGFRPTGYRDRKFVGLESVGEALSALGQRQTWGKVVVEVGEGLSDSKL